MLSDKLLIELEEKIKIEKLCFYSKLLSREYNLYLTEKQMWALLFNVFDYNYHCILSKYIGEIIPNEIINIIVMKYYPGEKIVKYNFIKKTINNDKEITLFEMYANNSRVDLCRINGKSIAYEIKTEIDSLARLRKQIEDYSQIFEYVYVITDNKHFTKVKEILPVYCGIINYNLKEGECKFSYKKKVIKSPYLNPEIQISNLSSNDLKNILNKMKAQFIPSTKKERAELILKKYDKKQINECFKYAIRSKYLNQWHFLKRYFSQIYPIDIQAFFHNPIDPKLAYYSSSNSDKV